MTRRRAFARGTLYDERAKLATDTVKSVVENIGAKRWEKETVDGYHVWKFWQRLISPYIHAIAIDPTLTEEQRMAATKEMFRRVREGINHFLGSVMAEAVSYSRTVVMAVPATSPKPSMYGHEAFRDWVV